MSIRKEDITRLIEQAQQHLTGASINGIKLELYDTIDEFVTDSGCWGEWIVVNILAGQQDYRITPAHGGMIQRLVHMHDSNYLGLPALLPELRPPGAILHIIWPQNNPLAAKAYVLKKVVLPTTKDDLPEAPEWLLPTYHRQIFDGLVGRMMAQPGKTYTSAQNIYHLKRFRDGIAVAKAAAMRSNLFGGQAWRFPRTYAGSSQRGGVSTPFPTPTTW